MQADSRTAEWSNRWSATSKPNRRSSDWRLYDRLPSRWNARRCKRSGRSWIGLVGQFGRNLSHYKSNTYDEARRELASDLIRHNDRNDLLEGVRLNEAVQRILDRLLFLRICEDRDIDTGRPLALILKSWRDTADHPVPRRARQSELLVREDGAAYADMARPAPQRALWRDVAAHFRALDRRPPSHIPFFNGNLFKPNFSEDLCGKSDRRQAG